jgi:hypothetical protein
MSTLKISLFEFTQNELGTTPFQTREGLLCVALPNKAAISEEVNVRASQ